MSESNGEKKTLEERLEAIVQTVELLGHMQLATEKKMEAADTRLQTKLDQIAEIQLDTDKYVNALARIAASHDARITSLEGDAA